jgi:hypothetical protein
MIAVIAALGDHVVVGDLGWSAVLLTPVTVSSLKSRRFTRFTVPSFVTPSIPRAT